LFREGRGKKGKTNWEGEVISVDTCKAWCPPNGQGKQQMVRSNWLEDSLMTRSENKGLVNEFGIGSRKKEKTGGERSVGEGTERRGTNAKTESEVIGERKQHLKNLRGKGVGINKKT